MKTFTILALLSTLAMGSNIPRTLIPPPSPVHTTTTAIESFYPMPTVVHPRHTSSPSSFTENDFHHVVDVLITNGGDSKPDDATQGENRSKLEDCWDRVEAWCDPYCNDMYPGPDGATKRQACRICIAVQSAFCLV